MKPRLHIPHEVPVVQGALERVRNAESKGLVRSAELEQLEAIKAERDPLGPNGEVDLHVASPHFKLDHTRKALPRSAEAELAIYGDMKLDRVAHHYDRRISQTLVPDSEHEAKNDTSPSRESHHSSTEGTK
jgi:hypothetical protein